MQTTNINWTDKVWNPITGCSKVSAGCKNCYAESIAKDFGMIENLLMCNVIKKEYTSHYNLRNQEKYL
ncbi:MAG: DUF5131 family protein [Chitinophagaceae bacterium]|nr:DUF5131 family protein [Chitinophagaceae bacterium]